MKILLKNPTIVNEGRSLVADVLLKDGLIDRIDAAGISAELADKVIECSGLHLLPGLIDDQVHFREPGLTHKATIASESIAAVAGGVTTFMEMPNTNPPALTQELLEEKYQIAKHCSPANYSFFMGTGLHNYDELMRTDPKKVCGIKIFMGSSTGEMLVDDEHLLAKIFANAPTLIATHCENDVMVKANLQKYIAQYGEDIPPQFHPVIRNAEACYSSSKMAADLAKKHGTRLHILHITTQKELELFDNTIPLKDKKITAEACVHHLWFCDEDYHTLGNQIKCNPAIKTASDRDAVFAAVLDDRIDIIATDHAPHTWEEKQQVYTKSPAGLPLVQHGLQMMLEKVKQGKITLEKLVEKMCHAPAELFQISKRGFIREGYAADLVLVDLNQYYIVTKENILYKCGWSPLENTTFSSTILYTFVNGEMVFDNGNLHAVLAGQRLEFER
ncbi:MAG: dihydroorotase [Bacteroidota bacterium]|nr:dihydroorotase [Bacteroidota bacterium]